MGGAFGSGTEGMTTTAVTIIVVFLSISFYNVLELTFILWGTFKRHSGLYFWSFLAAAWGIAIYSIGFVIKYFTSDTFGFLAAALIGIGWVMMVTGQSLVLWSRLHLILRNRLRLKMILWMIIIDAVILHGAVFPMIFGSFTKNPEMWEQPYNIIEKIQVTIFFIQEVIISSFYIAETVKLMRMEQAVGNRRSSRRLMNHLVGVNILIILLDITILGLEYANQYQYQTSYKAFVYSAKLKLEFTILNRLVEMTTGQRDGSSGPRSRTYGTHTNNKTGIALETFVSNVGDKNDGDVSYQAFAKGGDEGSSQQHQNPGRLQNQLERGVMMTTEVIVQREDRDEDDRNSLGAKSSAESTMGAHKTFDGEGLSKSSSEIHLASHRGF